MIWFNEMAESSLGWLWHSAWQAAIVAVVVFAILKIGHNRISSHLRYALLLIVLVKFAAPPFIGLSTGLFSQSFVADYSMRNASHESRLAFETPSHDSLNEVSNASVAPANIAVSAEDAVASSQATVPSVFPTDIAAVATDGTADARSDWSLWLICLYVLGVLICLIRLSVRYRSVRSVVARASLVVDGPVHELLSQTAREMGMSRSSQLKLSGEIEGPFVIGVFNPVIVLPEKLVEQLPLHQLEIVIAHELIHVRRMDLMVGWAEILLSATWWFHPAMWWLKSELRQAREDCCDDVLIAKRLAQPERYCETLIEAAASSTGQSLQSLEPLALGFANREHPAGRRIRRLMDSSIFRSDRMRVSAIVVALLLALVVLPGMRQAKPAQPLISLNNLVSYSLDSLAAIKVPLSATVPVRGIILGSDGKPAEGVQVWAASVHDSPPKRELALTDANGQFTLNLPRIDSSWWISACRGGSGVKIAANLDWLQKENPRQAKLLTAQLVDRGTFHCHVIAKESDQPISDARFYLGDGRVLVSDADGLIEIGGLQKGNHRMGVVAQGRLRKRISFDNTGDPNGKLNIRLPRAGSILGTVTDETGKPIPFAWIDASASGTAMALDGRVAIADENGNFVWDGIEYSNNVYWLEAGKEGYEGVRNDCPRVFEGKPQHIHFELKKKVDFLAPVAVAKKNKGPRPADETTSLANRDIFGTVIGPDKKPVADVTIRWGATIYEAVNRELKSDQEGKFVLRQVPDKDGYITVIGDNYAPQFVRVAKGKTQTKIQLAEGVSVGGTVVTPMDRPLKGVRVVPLIQSPDPSLCNPFWLSERAATTDEEGKFLITGLPTGAVLFDFLHDQMAELRNQRLELDSIDQTIQLASRGVFRGRVVDHEGNPVEDFRVKISFPREKRPTDLNSGGYDVVMNRIGNSYSHDEGKFTFGAEIVPAAFYRVTVQAEGYGETALDRVLTTSIDQVDDSEEYLFQLTPLNELSFKIVDDATGAGIPNARITIVNGYEQLDSGQFSWGSDGNGWLQHTANQHGVLVLSELSHSEGTVAIEADGYGCQRFGWRDGEKEFSVRLKPESVVTGKVTSTTGEPLDGLFVQLQRDDLQMFYRQLSDKDQGKFSIDGLSEGSYKLVLYDDRDELFSQQITIESGDEKNFSLTVDLSSRKVSQQIKSGNSDRVR